MQCSADYLVTAFEAGIGIYFAGFAVYKLLPLALGLLPGVSSGASVVKSLLPWHRQSLCPEASSCKLAGTTMLR